MNLSSERLCAFSAYVFVLLFGIGFWPLGGFIPPPSPGWTAAEVAAFYQHDTNLLRLGLLLMMTACGAALAFYAAISGQMLRIRSASPTLAYVQLAAGVMTQVLIVLPVMIWTAAAFHPERDPALTLLLHELGWLMLIMPFFGAMVQNIAIALAILADRSTTPLFPRWAAYFNFWTALLFVPGGLITFFKAGPFAWNGILAFWLPFVVFFSWFLLMPGLVLRAIGKPNSAH